MGQSDQRGAVRDPQQPQLDANSSRSRALAIVGGMLAVILLMFGAYRLGWSSGRSAKAAIEEGAPTAAEVVPVSVPTGVELDAAEAAAIGLKTAVAQVRAIARTVKLTGAVQVPPDSREFVGSRVEGKIATTHVNDGDTVKAGQVLATVQSAEFETLQTEFLRAAAELPVTEAAADRQRRLLEIDAVAQKDVENAVAQYEAKKSELAGLGERLQILGLSASQVVNLQKTRKLVRAVPVSARFAGVVINRNAAAGSPVNTRDPIFEIDNLATIWIEGDLFEPQLPSLHAGLAGAVTVPAYPGQVFEGKVQAVIPSVDREKRTSRLRVVLQNGKVLLEPGMFATLSITVGTEPSAVAVPINALIEQGSSTFVFVKNGEQFVQQDVVVSARDETYAQISFGLVPNDIVVTDGAMQLFAKSLYR